MQNFKNRLSPEGILNNIRTSERSDIVHRPCVPVGDMRNRGSKEPHNRRNIMENTVIVQRLTALRQKLRQGA